MTTSKAIIFLLNINSPSIITSFVSLVSGTSNFISTDLLDNGIFIDETLLSLIWISDPSSLFFVISKYTFK